MSKNNWLNKSAKLLYSNFLPSAAGIADTYLSNDETNDIGEIIMGYHLATNLLSETTFRVHHHKGYPDEEDEKNIKLAYKIAKEVLPENHPLLIPFLKEISYYEPSLKEETEKQLEIINEIMHNKAIKNDV